MTSGDYRFVRPPARQPVQAVSGALLRTGAPGAGKSSVLEELSTLLEIIRTEGRRASEVAVRVMELLMTRRILGGD